MKKIILFYIFIYNIISCDTKPNNLSDANELKSFGVLNINGDTLEFTLTNDTIFFDIPYSFNANDKLVWFAEASEKAFIDPNPKREKLDVNKHTELKITAENGNESIFKLSFKKASPIQHKIESFHVLNDKDQKIKTVKELDYLNIIHKDSIKINGGDGGGDGLSSGLILPSHSNGPHQKFYILDTLIKNSIPKKSLLIFRSKDVKVDKPKYESFENNEINIYKVYSEDGRISSEYIYKVHIE